MSTYNILSSRYLLNTSDSGVIKTPPSSATSVTSGSTSECVASSSSTTNDFSTQSDTLDGTSQQRLVNTIKPQEVSCPVLLDMTPEHMFLEYIDPFPAKPPSYDSANPNKFIRYPIYETPQTPSQVANESPPSYSPAVNEITLVQIKHEWLSPYEPADSTDWKDVIMEINSTQLNFYTIDSSLVKYRNKVRSRSGSDVNNNNGSNNHNTATDGHIGKNCGRKLLNFTCNVFNRARYSKLDAHDQRIICEAISADKGKYLNESTLYRTYSLQFAQFGVATDYTKKLLVLRLRCESQQFLINFTQVDDMIEWSVFLSMGIFVALDIELREYPDYRIVPPRRRRRRRRKKLTSSKGDTSQDMASNLQQLELNNPVLADMYRHKLGYDLGVSHVGAIGRSRSSSHSTTKVFNSFLKNVLPDGVYGKHHDEDWDEANTRYVRTQDDKVNEIYRKVSLDDVDSTYDGPRNTPHLYKSLSGQTNSSMEHQTSPRSTRRNTMVHTWETVPKSPQHTQCCLKTRRASVATVPTLMEAEELPSCSRGVDDADTNIVNSAKGRSSSNGYPGVRHSNMNSPCHTHCTSPRFRYDCTHLERSGRSPGSSTLLRSPLSIDSTTFDSISNIMSHPTSLSPTTSNSDDGDRLQNADGPGVNNVLGHHFISGTTSDTTMSTIQEDANTCPAFGHFLVNHLQHVPYSNELGTDSENEELYDDEYYGHDDFYANEDTYSENFEDTKWCPPIKEMSRRKYIKDSLRCIKPLTETQDWLASVVVRPVDSPPFETSNQPKIFSQKKVEQKFSFQRKHGGSCAPASRASNKKNHHLEAFVIAPSGFVKAENDTIRYLNEIKRKNGSKKNGVNWVSIH